jgi:hypothetical protein
MHDREYITLLITFQRLLDRTCVNLRSNHHTPTEPGLAPVGLSEGRPQKPLNCISSPSKSLKFTTLLIDIS